MLNGLSTANARHFSRYGKYSCSRSGRAHPRDARRAPSPQVEKSPSAAVNHALHRFTLVHRIGDHALKPRGQSPPPFPSKARRTRGRHSPLTVRRLRPSRPRRQTDAGLGARPGQRKCFLLRISRQTENGGRVEKPLNISSRIAYQSDMVFAQF